MKMFNIFSIIALATIAMGCGNGSSNNTASSESSENTVKAVVNFNADSAYAYTQKQCDFGPRVPETPAHEACGKWIEQQLNRFCDKVVAQPAPVTTFDGKKLNATNYIGIFNPEATERVLLLAHWDCRPWADNDPDESKHKEPVMGANDAASGTAVLLELARQMKAKKPGVGVDILLVDAEDWGTDDNEDSWALGTQYWVSHSHEQGYKALYGILLDMVGAKGATFHKEGFSCHYAGGIVDSMLETGIDSGYSGFFKTDEFGMVTDDHIAINKGGIPCIDIIDMRNGTDAGFFQYWHTTGDTMDKIDRATLKAVGQTVANYIYGL